MNPRPFFILAIVSLVVGSAVNPVRAAQPRKAPESDLATKDARRAVVELAAKIAKVETPEPLVDSQLAHPFSPAGFGQTGQDGTGPGAGAVSAGPAKPFGDHDILAAIAPRIMPSGTFSMGTDRLLIFGKKRLKAGDHLTVSFEGADYVLELVAIDRTNFTLRLNHEEITRPIKPGKNP
jgi:hypothetical protein